MKPVPLQVVGAEAVPACGVPPSDPAKAVTGNAGISAGVRLARLHFADKDVGVPGDAR